ncbi:MAG: flagellar biosynthetic protein FliQ [Kofleriaceae bacterium]
MIASLISLLGQALVLALWLATPILVATLLAGVVTGLVGALTQVQDPSIGVVVRVAAVAAALVLFAPSMARRLQEFAGAAMALIDRVGGG